MKLDNMFKKTRIVSRIQSHNAARASRPEVPEGLLRKCNKCGAAIITEDVKQNYYTCPKCGGYFRVHAYRRIQMVLDEGTFEEWDHDLIGENPMNYKGYPEKVNALQAKSGLKEAVVTGKGKINGRETVIAVCDGRFLMASMGWAVGEKITRAVERATKEKLPVIIFACSGGARMQEGITSLMQMAKTSAALERHSKAGLLYVSILTEPTTGGVTASFAMLGDIILAEPGALIGFAGPRVIEQTIRQKLPKGFQRAEFLVEHGFVDDIVRRENLKETLGKILEMHEISNSSDDSIDEMHSAKSSSESDFESADINPYLTAWDRVQISRKIDRPLSSRLTVVLLQARSAPDAPGKRRTRRRGGFLSAPCAARASAAARGWRAAAAAQHTDRSGKPALNLRPRRRSRLKTARPAPAGYPDRPIEGEPA